MADNLATVDNTTFTSEDSSFQVENLFNDFRFKVYRPTAMTAQRITVNLGFPYPVGFVALLGPLGEPFGIGSGETFKIEANNLDSWGSPPLTLDMSASERGGFRFLDDQTSYSYQYWSFYFNAPTSSIASFSNIYVGDYHTVSFSNVARGFQHTTVDPSQQQEAESGALYFRERTKYEAFDNITMNFLEASDYRTMKLFAEEVGVSRPFYMSLDPTLEITQSLGELTRFVKFTSPPIFPHARYDRFSFAGINVREVA
jgi:hypothetical protein